ncbi:MAG: Ig-like domain-containing protein [Gemmatimonadetes bacterium]|nr:Ig-like domain-containing protein [Gemmatimonadota bacterium]
MLACSRSDEPAAPAVPAVLRILGSPQLSLKVGAELQLSVVAVDAEGAEVRVAGAWSSSDTSVVRVETPGLVRAIGYGEADITVYHGGGSATVLVSTTPAGLRVRVLPADGIVEEGDSYVVVAEFLDVNGAVIATPLDVHWEASVEALLVPGGGKQTQVLRGLRAGSIDIVARSEPFRASVRLMVRPEAEPKLNVPTFTMWVDALPDGRMVFYPDLVVVAPFEATILRLVFDRTPKTLCATAPVSPGVATPLFDFIPYDFSWRGEALRSGTVVEVQITVQRADASLQVVRALGVVTPWDRTVVDYGTGGYPWNVC